MKYKNVKCRGFDSRKEAKRFDELDLLQHLGYISDLKRQVEFELVPKQMEGKRCVERAVKYIADFTYIQDGELVVEDVKSEITRKNPDYIIKRKLMLYMKGIRVREII